MDAGDYITAWVIYVVAALVISVMSWLFMKKYFLREVAYLLEGFLLAILFTPWYVLPDEEIMAPAYIVFLLDTITISAESGIRALIPLVMAMLLVIVVTVVLSLVYRIRRRKHKSGSA